MSSKRILVTGANGYIGSHVVQKAASLGHEVVACDICFDNIPEGIDTLEANIFDPELCIFDLAGKPDVLIHLAWRNGFKHNAESHLKDLPLHVQFLQSMVDAGIPAISVMGSMHEVGYWEGAINADCPTNPQSMYGISKNALRQALQLIVKETKTRLCWLRGYYIYGDDERSNSVLGKILLADRKGQELFPFTSGKNLYDFISVETLAHQIVAASVQERYTGIINCCSGEPISLGDMAERFIRDHGLNIRLQYGAFPDRAYDSPGVWGDATIIRDIMASQRG